MDENGSNPRYIILLERLSTPWIQQSTTAQYFLQRHQGGVPDGS